MEIRQSESEYFKRVLVKFIRPETKWSNHGQVEATLAELWRTELMYVEKYWDELWLGVKG